MSAMDRLELKLGGRMPADDLAQELADDAAATKNSLAAANQPAHDRQRHEGTRPRISGRWPLPFGAWLLPDAADAKEEAVRLADLAADGPRRGDGKADAPAAWPLRFTESAAAAQALADQLTDGRQKMRHVSSPAGVGPASASRAEAVTLSDPGWRSSPSMPTARRARTPRAAHQGASTGAPG